MLPASRRVPILEIFLSSKPTLEVTVHLVLARGSGGGLDRTSGARVFGTQSCELFLLLSYSSIPQTIMDHIT